MNCHHWEGCLLNGKRSALAFTPLLVERNWAMSSEEEITERLRQLWRLSVLECNQAAQPSDDPLAFSSKKADAVRSMICQLHFARDTKRISDGCFHELLRNYGMKYATIVDDFSGLNNYSDEALQLAANGGYRNDSSNWVSAFQNASIEDIQKYLPKDQKIMKGPGLEDFEAFRREYQQHNNKTEPISSLTKPTSSSENACSLDKPRIGTGSSCLSPWSTGNVSNSSGDKNLNLQPNKSFAKSNNDFYSKNNTGQNNFNNKDFFTRCDQDFKKPVNTFVPNQKRKHQAEENKCETPKPSNLLFQTAKEKLVIDSYQKQGGRGGIYGTGRKSLGSRRDVTAKFVPPVANRSADSESKCQTKYSDDGTEDMLGDEKLKNIDPKMIELMKNEIMDHGPPVSWDDIAGLKFAKTTIQEIVVWPLLRPDLFVGLRGPPKGILLFGPPGTGKTLIGKCIASQSKSTFFCISASSMTSKWVGEGEKLVRALFAVARYHQPSVIFIDEIDSLLTQRSDSEHESSRRIKTEFLVQLDGATTATDERLLIVGATNRPQELDEAARRRLVKRLYIPLPEAAARKQIICKLVSANNHFLTPEQLELICSNTEGYSGADMANLCKEAALGPIRDLNFADIERITPDQVRPINLEDFMGALKQVRASVSEKDLQVYVEWNGRYGSGAF